MCRLDECFQVGRLRPPTTNTQETLVGTIGNLVVPAASTLGSWTSHLSTPNVQTNGNGGGGTFNVEDLSRSVRGEWVALLRLYVYVVVQHWV